MGLCILSVILGAAAPVGWADWLLAQFVLWGQVALGLGFVIFVHELGHFLVAKACGVKCEKFYLGFDINGWRLFRYRWGETEYGVGILPLGGYVKMLGQDDNPGQADEERERSTIAADEGQPVTYDPRSYMAKSVPQRMAIISAGVVMNLIFAVIMATIAYRLGVEQMPCAVGGTIPGEAAWRSDLHPGDRVVQIGPAPSKYELRWQDLMAAVAFADLDKGVDFLISRRGVDEPFHVNIKPGERTSKRLQPTIGVFPLHSLARDEEMPTRAGTTAAESGKFTGGEELVAINGVRLNGYQDYLKQLAEHPNDALDVTVRRKAGKSADEGAEETISLPPQPRKTLGLEMAMGKISAVEANSPAAEAGLLADDFIVRIGDEVPGDPLTLPERLRRRAGQTITITIERTGANTKAETLPMEVTLREPQWYEEPHEDGKSISAPALGVAYRVLNRIQAIEPDSPAAKATLTLDGQPATAAHFVPGDQIVQAVLTPPSDSEPEHQLFYFSRPLTITFGEGKPNWPNFDYCLQVAPPGTKVTLTLEDNRTAELTPVDSSQWHDPDRGILLPYEDKKVAAQSWGEALRYGARDTKDMALMVFSFVKAVVSGRVSAKNVGGPVMIFKQAAHAANAGASSLLLFLTMLSANLAVFNFLPIPMLDGGHIVFLALEGILGRPVSERVVVAFHYLGLAFIVALMLFALSLDFGLISRSS